MPSKTVRRRRVVRKRSHYGGFAFAAIPAVHAALQQIKPITNGVALAKSLGVADRINSALDSNAAGRAVKAVGSFLQNKLGYGSKTTHRRRHVGGRRVVRRRRVGGSKTASHRRRR